ncbi:MAG: CBS domain-containing protein [Segniliparus sp.]|uniref:CBS domain-containing protein n=1 Tax=Segniliparus sp. TaxID=2804064 RepID=UPI003F353C13
MSETIGRNTSDEESEMRARDIMSSPVVTVTPDTSIHEATAVLAARGFTSLPVVDKDKHLVGMVGEDELMRVQASLSDHPVASTVESAMRVQSAGASLWSPASELAALLAEEGARCVPVLQDRYVVGIVTRRDLLKALSRDERAILRDVRARLSHYAGAQQWAVEINNGTVAVEGRISAAEDPMVVTALVDSIPGVTAVKLLNLESSELPA